MATEGSTTEDGTGFQAVTNFRRTQRNLPHFQEPGRTYFVTFRGKHGEMTDEARKMVFDACLFWNRKKFQLHACVVMPDHVHLLLTPFPKRDQDGYFNLSEVLHSVKSYSSNQINRLLGSKGPFWLDESFDRIVRSEQEFLEKWNYIRNNPVKKELVDVPEKYPFLFEENRDAGFTGREKGITGRDAGATGETENDGECSSESGTGF